jgi:hypothetical protein
MDYEAHMEEARKYYVTVAVDSCVIPEAILILAANRAAANRAAVAQRVEMKVALRMHDAIAVRAIKVREG